MVSAIPKAGRVAVINDPAAIANADGKVENIEGKFFVAAWRFFKLPKKI